MLNTPIHLMWPPSRCRVPWFCLLPDPGKPIDVLVEHVLVANPPNVKQWIRASWTAPDMRINHHLVVIPEDAGVYRRVVQSDSAICGLCQFRKVRQRCTDLGPERAVYALFLVAQGHGAACWLSETEPYGYPRCRPIQQH